MLELRYKWDSLSSFSLRQTCWCENKHKLYFKVSQKLAMIMDWMGDAHLQTTYHGFSDYILLNTIVENMWELDMCARHLLLSTRILCSPARPELSAAPTTRWQPAAQVWRPTCAKLLSLVGKRHMYFFFLLMLPRYLKASQSKGISATWVILFCYFFFTAGLKSELERFRLHVFAPTLITVLSFPLSACYHFWLAFIKILQQSTWAHWLMWNPCPSMSFFFFFF